MKKRYAFPIVALWLLCGLAHAAANPALIDMENLGGGVAPAELSYESYAAWAKPIVGEERFSAFTAKVFEWYEEEKGRGLPAEVAADPARLYANVEKPLRQTIELEEAGEIEEGNTVGAEVYVEMDGDTEQALATLLHLWGKPVGAAEGASYPAPSPFSKRIEYFAPVAAWGEGAYVNLSLRRNGGIVKDLSDRYLVLVRGNAAEGYAVVMQYVKPAAPYRTFTQQVFAIGLIRPVGEGKVSYRISTRYQGQSYKVLGNVSIGRGQIGFNERKVREVMEEYRNRVKELKDTGSITERKNDLEWGK